MEIGIALVVFAVIGAIAVAGLVISTRRAEANDASRHAHGEGPVVHPKDQQIPQTTRPLRPTTLRRDDA
jgi:hypothetical protein